MILHDVITICMHAGSDLHNSLFVLCLSDDCMDKIDLPAWCYWMGLVGVPAWCVQIAMCLIA